MHKLTVPRVAVQSAGATLLLERVAVWRYYQEVTPLLDRLWVNQQKGVIKIKSAFDCTLHWKGHYILFYNVLYCTLF